MLHLLKKLKLYTKLELETVHKALISIHEYKYTHKYLLLIICRLPEPTKVFLQLEHHNTELLLYL